MIINPRVTCDHNVGTPVQPYVLSKCPRCRGRGYYYAFNITKAGRIDFIDGYEALSILVRKILIEKKRSSGYGFDYDIFALGTSVRDLSTTIKQEVSRSLTYLRNAQQQVEERGYTYRTTERIDTIDTITVERNTTDPRAYAVTVYLTTQSGRNLQISQTITS